MVSEHIEMAMKKIEGWWDGELIGDRTCIGFFVPRPGKFLLNYKKDFRLLRSLVCWHLKQRLNPSKKSASTNTVSRNWTNRMQYQPIYSYFNDLWPHPAEKPVDVEKFVEAGIGMIKSLDYFGEAIPKFPHLYGLRGAPLLMPAFLGAELEFLEDTILVKPFIDKWDASLLELRPPNLWYEMSLKMAELAAQKSKGEFLVDLPDFGDVFTCLYLLKGAMIFQDMGLEPKLLEARDKFMNLWIEAYENFWETTSQKLPGSSHWLIWAPGKSYACQCDASCIALTASKPEVAPFLLERIVEDFILPEMEKLGKYLDYIIWHLDGEEELKFLDILLELPQIKAIQWRPTSSSPSDTRWIPLLEKIQKAKKSVWIAAENEKEVENLIENLSPERLYISGGFTGKTEKEAREFLKRIKYLTKQKIKNRSF